MTNIAVRPASAAHQAKAVAGVADKRREINVLTGPVMCIPGSSGARLNAVISGVGYPRAETRSKKLKDGCPPAEMKGETLKGEYMKHIDDKVGKLLVHQEREASTFRPPPMKQAAREAGVPLLTFRDWFNSFQRSCAAPNWYVLNESSYVAFYDYLESNGLRYASKATV